MFFIEYSIHQGLGECFDEMQEPGGVVGVVGWRRMWRWSIPEEIGVPKIWGMSMTRKHANFLM
jgi:hypothetical protein